MEILLPPVSDDHLVVSTKKLTDPRSSRSTQIRHGILVAKYDCIDTIL